jgi:hypothetical protein
MAIQRYGSGKIRYKAKAVTTEIITAFGRHGPQAPPMQRYAKIIQINKKNKNILKWHQE